MVDVIEIDDSDDDETESFRKGAQANPGSFSNGPPNGVQVISSISSPTEPCDQKPQNPQEVEVNVKQESRTEAHIKKIDQLLDIYIKYHHRLISVEYMMTPEQIQRWKSHLATSYGSVSALIGRSRTRKASQENEERVQQDEPQPSTSNAGGWQRPAWFIDPPGSSGAPARRATYRRTGTIKRRATKRRKKTSAKPKLSVPRTARKTTASSVNPVSRKPKSVTTPPSRPKPSTGGVKERKPKVTKLQAMLAKVKKERK